MDFKERVETIKKTVDDFAALYAEIPSILNEANAEMKYCDDAILDIRHYVEPMEISASQGYTVGKMLKTMQVRRREAKNLRDSILPLGEFLCRHKTVAVDLNTARGTMRREFSRVTGPRHYNPRVLFELFGQEPPVTAVSLAMKKNNVH